MTTTATPMRPEKAVFDLRAELNSALTLITTLEQQLAAARLAGKIEGMEAAIEVVKDVCWCEPETVEAAIRAKSQS